MHTHTGIDGPNFSKWKAGHVPKVEVVARFARAYNRPVLEAFVAAGFLTEAEAEVKPVGKPDFSRLTNDELLELVSSRIRQRGGGRDADGDAGGPAPMKPRGPQPPDRDYPRLVDQAARDEDQS